MFLQKFLFVNISFKLIVGGYSSTNFIQKKNYMKMRISKLLNIVIVINVMCLLSCATSSILIDMEPEEIQRLGQILVQAYIKQEASTTAMSKMKRVTTNVLKLSALMFTLVGANILTTKFELLIFRSGVQMNTSTHVLPPINITQPDLCVDNDYGCDDNMCWRTCKEFIDSDSEHVDSEKDIAWCFTTPNRKEKHYHHCVYTHECSPCWSCLGSCHPPVQP